MSYFVPFLFLGDSRQVKNRRNNYNKDGIPQVSKLYSFPFPFLFILVFFFVCLGKQHRHFSRPHWLKACLLSLNKLTLYRLVGTGTLGIRQIVIRGASPNFPLGRFLNRSSDTLIIMGTRRLTCFIDMSK